MMDSWWYVQPAAVWRCYLPLCIYAVFGERGLSIPVNNVVLMWYQIRWNDQ